ncbi:hypothetical protein [Pontibacter liquoris]|uniref:hypothetical protein n=1 Tax=Pontibacter liquoris TaxID=2905677 RepID=UPI001FA7FBC0|nr:hypothetical protein [Pontibacter liquoris]
MNRTLNWGSLISGLFALVLTVIAVLNAVLVHPVPGIIYLLLAILYLPQTNTLLRKKLGFPIPAVVKILLGIVLMMFTLGVSDLGDMIDKL